MSPAPPGPAGAASSGDAAVPRTSGPAQALSPAPAAKATTSPATGSTGLHTSSPARPRDHNTTRPPPQVLCAPVNTAEGPSQDQVPAALQ
eukprot:6488343-Amphidinium_carterae.1